MRSLTFLLLFLAAFTPLSISAQKVLKMDTPKTFGKASYLPAAPFVFQIEGDDRRNQVWHEEYIKDFDTDRQIIYFETWQIHVSQIVAVKIPRKSFGRRIAGTLLTFGLTALALSGVDAAYGCTNCGLAAGVGVGSAAVGFLWLKRSPYKIYRIGKKNKLRLFDLTPKPENKNV
jgi:hypothetical protein